MKLTHKILAIALGGTGGALLCYGLRVMQLDMDNRTRNPVYDAVSLFSVAFGFAVGAVCGLFFVPGKNPWRW